MKTKTSPHRKSLSTARADTAADKHGHTVPLGPANRRRLFELQTEVEKSTGPGRVEAQREIESVQKAASK